jgi:hypothetical protein
MKKLILSVSFVAGAALVTHAQGTININNYANTGAFNGQSFNGVSGNPVYSSTVTSGGLIFTLDPAAQAGTVGYSAANSQMLGADVNFALYGGATAGTATTLLESLTGSAITGDNGNWGQLSDIAGNVYSVPGSAASSTVYLDLEVWEGNATSYAAAVAAGAYTGNTGVFANASGGGLSAPVSLTGMPDLQLATSTVIPEPSTLAMAGVGLASMLFLRRKTK